MGIYSRDYIREDRPGGFGGISGTQWAIKYLIIANIAVFLLQNLPDVGNKLDQWGAIRLPMKTGASASFFPNTWQGVDLERPVAEIPVGTPVDVVAMYDAGGRQLCAIRWQNEVGFVPAADLQFNLLGAYQWIWQLVTYGFLHGSLMHIGFNMLVLWMFGRAVEPILGSREFLAFYLVGVVISGLGHIAFSLVWHSPAGAIGASGGVMAVVFLTAMTFPRSKVYFMLFIPMELWVMAIIYALVDVLGLLNAGSGVAHAAHLGGAAFGAAYKHYDWRMLSNWHRLTGWSSGIRRTRRSPNVRIFSPTSDSPTAEPIDDEVDRILEKIHQQGEASLTDEEREILKEASRRLKQR